VCWVVLERTGGNTEYSSKVSREWGGEKLRELRKFTNVEKIDRQQARTEARG
jgi:hypothetical protein